MSRVGRAMTDTIAERVLSTFGLTPDQRTAALERGRDVVVTAGAGSGKTRTLVARYASLLADGLLPRRVVAVTFTDKAAKEMRSRVRDALRQLAENATADSERQTWLALSAQLDSARIGTIHSLCAEILRAHPAEAGIDPRFDVLDEGITAALRAQVVADTLITLVGLPQYSDLFRVFHTGGVLDLLEYFLNRRLEAQESFSQDVDGNVVIKQMIQTTLNSALLAEPIAALRAVPPAALLAVEGDKLAGMVTTMLAFWREAETALASGDVVGCAGNLFQARRSNMRGNLGKKDSTVKETVKALKETYDELLNPLIGGADSKDVPASRESEALFAQLLPLVRSAFELLHQSYQQVLRQRQALDFDDLENGAAQLLKRKDIRARWQAELDALLVDEFQDTNARQREIVEALAGSPGRLFVVGDARQSIYRFRRADVTVFRAIQQRVKAQGGLVVELDLTYRAHEPLLSTTGNLLATVMGTEPDPLRPYYVPFSALNAYRKDAPEYVAGPHVEIVLGDGEDSGSARPAAAHALALRLLELKTAGQIRTWDDVALLFRASTGYVYYEDALEETGIPFVTVSGRGFYDRPEIRDVLNILRALADPADDLSMAGMLRSPAFGLSDAALYQLRWGAKEPVPYWQALQADLSGLGAADQSRAVRAVQILNELLPLVDRVQVAELLKRLVDVTDYRAILAADDSSGTGGRLWRNLDKLMGDAQGSGQINVRDFLQYIVTISDAGAREGEAPAEAQGAVRLMTIHKSKGLEFPLVVLADSGRVPRGGSETAYLLPELGLAFKLENPPLLYRFAKWQDKQQSDAETQRLLYVALTRAKDKLIISGHAASARGGGDMVLSGWMANLCEAAGVSLGDVFGQTGTPLEVRTGSGYSVRAWCMSDEANVGTQAEQVQRDVPDEKDRQALYMPLVEPVPALIAEDEHEITRIWRATGTGKHVPAGVIGQMVHKAIERWLFPDDAHLIPMLESAALNAGLASTEQRIEAVRRVRELLGRLRDHPLWDEMNSALERHHEVPYSRMVGEHAETGYIDLLYRTPAGWQVVDFKTDSIRSAAERETLISQYHRQMNRYAEAVTELLGELAKIQICFLDDVESINTVILD